MTRTSRLLSLVVVSPAIVTAIASTAHAHARLKSPAPRDSGSSYKDPPQNNVGTGQPCGNNTRTASQPSTTLTPGVAATVTWEETVNHPGCFVVDFSASGDTNFTVLGVKSHMNPPAPASPTTASPRPWSVGITVPTTPCTACTIRVRQLMLTADVPDSGCPPATIPAASTYYSCANVVIGGSGGTGGAGAGGTTGAAGSGGRGGTTGAGGRGGSSAAGQGGTTGQAGSGAGQAGTSGQAGTFGQAGTNGQAGTFGQAGANGQAGQAGTDGQAGTNGEAGTTGQAGSSPTGTGGTIPESSGGCVVGGASAPAPLALLIAIAALRRFRRRSRS